MQTCYVIRLDAYQGAIADLYAPGELISNAWVISRISVPEDYRGRGFGRKLLERILAEADRDRVTLALEIVPSGGMTYEDLESWYSRNGFKYSKFGYMIRSPK